MLAQRVAPPPSPEAYAKKLPDAFFPCLKDIDWHSDLYIKPLPDASFPQSLRAVDKMIVTGNAVNGNLLKAAAEHSISEHP